MAFHGVKSTTDPSVATDPLSFGEVQLVKEMVGTSGNETVLPSDATLGKAVYVTSFQGPTAVDAPVTTEKPLPVGGRATDGAPTLVSAAGDLQMLWLGTDGAANVYSRIDGALVVATTVQPTATGYVSGDVIGNVLQFNGAALGNGRGLTINSVQCEDKRAASAVDIKLALFCASPTSPPADSALFSTLTHANRIAASPIAVVSFDAANFVNGWCEGQVNGGPFSKNAYPAGTTVFGIAYFGTTAVATAADGSFWFGMDVTYN